MSAVISNSDPMTYLREHADIEHDTVRVDAVEVPEAFNQLDILWQRIQTLRDKRNAERRQSKRLSEEIVQLTRERNETDAYIGTLDAELAQMIEQFQQAVRS